MVVWFNNPIWFITTTQYYFITPVILMSISYLICILIYSVWFFFYTHFLYVIYYCSKFQEKDAFYKRKELLRGKLNKNLKKRIIKSMIWSVVLYGSETWTMRKEDIKRLEAFEMWIWRRMERISWMEHRANEEILKMVDEKRSMIGIIRS